MRHDPDTEMFHQLLRQYSAEADTAARAAVEHDIWQRFGTEQAVLVLDMSGFSSLTSRYGVVHYLSMVHRMQHTAMSAIDRCSGVILKFEADNAFAMFPSVQDAVLAALELNMLFDEANRDTPDELDIRIACGIDFGRILVIGGHDFFGDAVNRASKLGEDLAAPREILLTREAAAQLQPTGQWRLDPLELSVSGIAIAAVALRADATAAGG